MEQSALIGFIITIGVSLLSNVSAVIMAIISWRKSNKMMPKEIEGANLDNISKEISIAEQYDQIATSAAQKVIETQNRLNALEKSYGKIEQDYHKLGSDYEKLEKLVTSQSDIIKKQTDRINKQDVKIKEQDVKIKEQDVKIKEQDDEITLLLCELKNSRLYNIALIRQMKGANLIPVEPSDIGISDCNNLDNDQQ